MGPRRAITLLVWACLIVMTPHSSAVAASQPLRAKLDGTAMPLASVGRFHCHDLRYPTIECFRRRVDVERAAKRILAGPSRSEPTLALATSYVRVFEHSSFAGASAYFSVSYPDLRTIGWNDRISSYLVVNGGSGTFYEHISYGGRTDSFCCAQSVSNVGSTFNDTFSSVSGSA
jgi:hypothetical protein